MGINWVTFIAQIVNLFILVWLLKKFLYRPILNAVDKRQAEIIGRVEKARQEHKAAENEHNRLLQKQADFETQKQKMYDETSQDVSTYRTRQIQEIEKETLKIRQRIQNDLNKENETLHLQVRNLLVDNFIVMSKKIMTDLSSVTPLEQTIRLFKEKVLTLSKSEISNINKSYLKHNVIKIISSDTLIKETADSLSDFFKKALDSQEKLNIHFEKDDSLILGVEMTVGDISLEWNLRTYLDEYHTNLNNTLSTLVVDD